MGQTADPSQWRLGRDSLVLVGLFGLYFLLKYAMVVRGILPEAFLIQAAVTVMVVVYLLRITTNPQLLRSVAQRNWLKLLLVLIGTISLEVYLVHIPMVPWPVWQRISFPVNVCAFLVCALVVAWAANLALAAIFSFNLPWRKDQAK
jgi:peptidoglycan/LPS O-acetylase OafA/YrhL